MCYVSVADFLKITDPMILIKLPPVGFLRVLKEGRQTGDLVDIVQKVVQLTINRRQEDQLSRSDVQIGNDGRESSVASLMCSQFKRYENEILDTRTNISPFKKATYLFGKGLASYFQFEIQDSWPAPSVLWKLFEYGHTFLCFGPGTGCV